MSSFAARVARSARAAEGAARWLSSGPRGKGPAPGFNGARVAVKPRVADAERRAPSAGGEALSAVAAHAHDFLILAAAGAVVRAGRGDAPVFRQPQSATGLVRRVPASGGGGADRLPLMTSSRLAITIGVGVVAAMAYLDEDDDDDT
jgi:hypothetical protein